MNTRIRTDTDKQRRQKPTHRNVENLNRPRPIVDKEIAVASISV